MSTAPFPFAPRSNRAWFASLGPLAKLSLWAAAMVVLVAVIELLAWITNLPFSTLDKNAGGTLFMVVALVSLLAVISTDRRPLAEYGLVVPSDWRKQALRAAAVGALVYVVYCIVATALGVFELHTAGIIPARLAKAALAAASSVPIATVQQLVFAGLLLGMLRRASNAWIAVLVPAVVFGAFAGMAKQGGLISVEGQRLFVGMVLLAILLGMLRLRTGSVVFPAGLLAGAIAVRKVLSKIHLLECDAIAQWTPWLAPNADARQGPVMWLVLCMAIAGVGLALYRWGEVQVAEDATAAASFKRVMPFSNLLAFAPLDRWLSELARARFRVGVVYLPRLLFTLGASALTTILSLPERLLAPLWLKHQVPPPVFIVGMHRSGTTYLHELLALDPQFRSPRNYEVFNPHGFLTGWLTTVAMTPLLMWRRPMDAVQMTTLSSQEEEFALAAMGGESPYWMFCFPQSIGKVERYWNPDQFSPSEFSRWQRNYLTFLRKITWRSTRRPLLKNPVNTSRVDTLRTMFPDAQFVNIVRHPHAVYKSNLHFAKHGFAVFQLQDAAATDSYEHRILSRYRSAAEACHRDLAKLPPGRATQIRFEDLEFDPVATIEQLYEQLNLELTDSYRTSLMQYTSQASGYQKNQFSDLSPAECLKVDAAMGPFLLEWGYANRSANAAA